MKKSELFKAMWIPVERRRPSADESKMFLWLTSTGYVGVTTGLVLSGYFEQLDAGEINLKTCHQASPFLMTHWMEVIL